MCILANENLIVCILHIFFLFRVLFVGLKRLFCHYDIDNGFVIDLGLQVIKTKGAAFNCEIIEDSIKISQQNLWEIKFNVRTGAFESWKVVHTIFLLFFINSTLSIIFIFYV